MQSPDIRSGPYTHLYFKPFSTVFYKKRAKPYPREEKMQIFSTCVKCWVEAAFFAGLFFIKKTSSAEYQDFPPWQQIVMYNDYVQLLCQTGENRQKYQVKPLNLENFTWLMI